MKRPTAVRVQGKPFSIDYVREYGLTVDCMGITFPAKLKIYIQDDLPVALEQDTLFHEITHAIEKSMGLDINEAQVNALSCGWIQVLRDNPALCDYFKKVK